MKTVEDLFESEYGISVPHSWCAYNGKDMVKFAKLYAQHSAPEMIQRERVPNLSTLDKSNKDEFINEFVEMTAKNVLSVFVALGLKTHIEVTVVNDADGNKYKLSFIKLMEGKK